MSSPFAGYLEQGALRLFHDGRSVISSRSVALESLVMTVKQLQAAGKRPILVAPPPKPGFDIGACREQEGSGLVVLGRVACDFLHTEHERNQRGIVEGLREVRARTAVDVVWLDPLICTHGLCKTMTADGMSVYKDGGHLSIPGSSWLVPQLGIEHLLLRLK
jgi:SGNH domain (fused to AT3 domains)